MKRPCKVLKRIFASNCKEGNRIFHDFDSETCLCTSGGPEVVYTYQFDPCGDDAHSPGVWYWLQMRSGCGGSKTSGYPGLLVTLRDVKPVLASGGGWVASSPRSTKFENSRLVAVNRAQWLSGCSQARSQLSNAQNFTFQLVRTAELWVRVGFTMNFACIF